MINVNKSIAFFTLTLLLGGCAGVPPATTTGDQTVLSRANKSASGSKNYFGNRSYMDRVAKIAKEYNGSLRPGDALYLEKDVYFLESESIEQYVNSLANQLLANGWNGDLPDFTVRIESRDDVCATADDLRTIRICTGLLRHVNNESALAGVIAHELGHILLKHNTGKRSSSNMGWGLSFVGGLALMVEAQRNSSDSSEFQVDKRDALRLQAFGVLWSEFLTPNWSRNQEEMADLIAVDLLEASGFKPLQYQTFVADLEEVVIASDGKWSVFRQLALQEIKRLASEHQSSNENIGDTIVRGVAMSLANGLVESFFDGLVKQRADRETPLERSTKIASYYESRYGELDKINLNPERSNAPDNFQETLKRGRGSFVLEADRRASALVRAIQFGDVATARQLESLLFNYPEVQSGYALARAESSSRRYGGFSTHSNEIERALSQMQAPASLYVRVAEQRISNGQPEIALQIVDNGMERIGRVDRFLPTRVRALQKMNLTDQAEAEVLRCQDRDSKAKFSSLGNLFSKPTLSLYSECSNAIGYDVIETQKKRKLKKQQERERARERKRAEAERVRAENKKTMKSLQDTWDKIRGKRD